LKDEIETWSGDRANRMNVSDLKTLVKKLKIAEEKVYEHLMRKMDSEKSVIEEEFNCIVCMDKKRTRISLPCNHFVLCEVCVGKITDRKCPKCRRPVTSFLTVYL